MADFVKLFLKLNKESSDRDACAPGVACPKDKKPAIFVLVATADTADPVAGIEVDVSKPTSQKKKTGGDGMAKFDPAKVGSHVVRFNLTPDQAKKFTPLPAREVNTTDRKTTTLLLLLTPLPSLQVIVERSDDHKVIGGAKVELTGPETLNGTTAAASGIATFERLKPGRYDVKITLTAEQVKTLDTPVVVKKTILAGQNSVLKVLVHPRGKVDPTLVIADPKVVLVKRDYMDKASNKVTPHRLPVQVSVSAKFDGTGRLTCTLPAKLKLFDTPKGGTAKAFPLALTSGQLTQGLNGGAPFTLYLEGAEPSASTNDVQLNLELQGGKATLGAPVSDKLTCVRLKLDICKWRVNDATAPVPMAEADKIEKGRYLHEQNKELHHERARLIVYKAEPADFKGALRLQAWDLSANVPSDQVLLVDKEKGADPPKPNPFDLSNASIPNAGQEFWVEGKKASESLLDTALRLGLANLPDDGSTLVEGDRVSFTVLRIPLALYQSRPASGAEPQPMKDADQVTVGRFLHKQDAKFNHGRPKLVLEKVKPDGFKEKLRLAVWDITAKSEASPRVKLFDQEIAATGQAASAMPLEIETAGAFPAKGKVWWVEGATTSGALRDTEIRLSLADHLRVCARAALTVVEFTKIKVTIKPTPANTARAGAVAPVDHTHEVTSYEEDFTKAETLVLMRNAQPDIALEVTTKPDRPVDLPILWKAVRNKDDHGNLGEPKKVPIVTRNAADKRKAVLNANEKGSFHIRPFLDGNGEDEYSPKEPSLPLKLILIDVTFDEANDKSRNRKAPTATITAGGSVNVQNGVWDAGMAGGGMYMELTADVTGGGANGLLGLDPTSMVFAGLINMTKFLDIHADYRDPGPPVKDHQLKWALVSNKDKGSSTYRGLPLFKPGDDAPALLAQPLLDSGKTNAGTGGDTATMRSSTVDAPTARPVGQRWKIKCFDSPGGGFSKTHPVHAAAILRRVFYQVDFKASFCFWTNHKGVESAADAVAVDAVANRVYSVVRVFDWRAEGAWDVSFPGGVATLTADAAKPHTVSIIAGTPASVSPIGRCQDNAVEVRPPAAIPNVTFDAQS